MKNNKLITSIFIVTTVLIWGLSWYWISNKYGDWAERAAFGSMFGAVGALFSGLAFAILIVAILLQSQQLDLQRQDLKETQEGLKRERFEDTFFQLLKLHYDIVNSIDISIKKDAILRGRDCFVQMYNEFMRNYRENSFAYELMKNWTGLDKAYSDFYETRQVDLGHYFRNLYHTVGFVDNSDISDKRFYTNLIGAQLSSHEQLLLFYNCLSSYGKKFKTLVEKYGLLENMPRGLLLSQDHIELYESLRMQPAKPSRDAN